MNWKSWQAAGSVGLLFLLSACCSCPKGGTHAQVPPSLQSAGASGSSTALFPNGSYRHDVKIHIAETGNRNEKNFNLQGLAKIQADRLDLVVLSPFQTTLMKVTENRVTGDVQTEIYNDSLKKYQDKFAQYYSLLRQILILRRPVGEDPAEVTLISDPSQKNTEQVSSEVVHLSEYQDHIPHSVQLKDPHFSLQMHVEPLEIKHD